MKSLKYIFSLLLGAVMLSSCGEDFMKVEVTEYLDGETATEVFASDPTALYNLIDGMYSWLVTFNVSGNDAHDDFSFMSVLHSTDLMGEDIALNAAHWFNYDYLHDNGMFNYRRTIVDWSTFYTLVSKCNEVLDMFTELPTENIDSKGIVGQSFALRAFAYYYLVQLYQHPVKKDGTPNLDAPGVPMYYSILDKSLDASLTDEVVEACKGRNTVGKVYAQIESDIDHAIDLLEGYERSTKNYVDQYVAYGIKARYCMLSQQWQAAADAAKKAQAGGELIYGLNDGFYNLDSDEWMWGFDHNTETQTAYASFFSHISSLGPGYAGLAYSTRLIDKKLYESIPVTDTRKKWFNGPEGNDAAATAGAKLPYANIKFGYISGWTMDYMYMRVAEMYLIEAEALAHMGKEAEAATAIKPLMQARISGWDKAAMSVEDVYQQRRIELWGEGFSYFDLKRLNKGINRAYEGNNHLVGFQLVKEPLAASWRYQIPRQEMQENTYITEEEQNKY